MPAAAEKRLQDVADVEFERPVLYPKQFQAIYDARRFSLIEATVKAGKAQPLDSIVWTPSGPRLMGDLKVGDRVCTPLRSATIRAIYPQGVRDIYRVRFLDGTEVRCDAEHLWEVHDDQRDYRRGFQHRLKSNPSMRRRKDRVGWPRVLTLLDLCRYSKKRLRRMWVPAIEPVEFVSKPVPLDPYLVGVLIGDGSLTGESARLSSADDEIISAVRGALPFGHTLEKVPGDNVDWSITAGKNAARLREAKAHIRSDLRDMGLLGKGSHEKFIPEMYRINSVDVRWKILRGILDTDGTVDSHGQPVLDQTSERLAQDITELVESLGGSVYTNVKLNSGYRKNDGTFVQCRPVYRQAIRLCDPTRCFSLQRKRDRTRIRKRSCLRRFESIKFVGKAEAQCIEIDDPRGLYLTDGFVPTHNTSGCISWLVELALGGRDGWNYWWVAPVSDQSAIAFRRMCRALPHDLYVANLTLRTITLANGAIIWFKSADRPDGLYGEDVYGAVLDEASRMKEDAWIAVRSTLTYTRGPIRIIGNVRGKRNWAYRLARRAEQGDPEMGYHKITANDAVAAGVLDAKEIEDARSQLPEQAFRELYLAEASDDGGNPFGLQHVRGCIVPNLFDAEPAAWGWDLGKKRDYTVGVGVDLFGHVCRLERWNEVPWDETVNRILAATQHTPALVDSTGLGDPIVDMLQKRRQSVFEGYTFSPASKQKLMEGLAVAIQSRGVTYPEGPISHELEQFEFVPTRTGVRYCVAPDTPVLTDDLKWVEAGSLRVGDGLLAFDEMPMSGKKTRTWRRAAVTESAEITRPCYEVAMADRTMMTVSAEHLWLIESAGRIEWRKTRDLRGEHPSSRSDRDSPTRIMKLVDRWDASVSYEAGYLAGAFDGEGSLTQSRKESGGHNTRLSFAQRENERAQEVRTELRRFGFSWTEHAGGNGAGSCKAFGLTGRRHEFLRFLGQIRPKRLLEKFNPDLLGTLDAKEYVPITQIKFVGEKHVTALGTTSKTFVASGFASHNSAPAGFYDDCVMALALAVMRKATMPAQFQFTPEMVRRLSLRGPARVVARRRR